MKQTNLSWTDPMDQMQNSLRKNMTLHLSWLISLVWFMQQVVIRS